MELKFCNAFLFLAIAIAYVSAQRNYYHPQYYQHSQQQQQQQQQQFSRRRSEPMITRNRVEKGDILSNVGWTAAGLALIGSAATIIAANADSIREQLAAVSSRQLQRQQLPDMEDIFGTSVESCWQLAICDAHARYDDHYKVVALPLTMYYQGSSSANEVDAPYEKAAVAGKAREDCNKKYNCLVNPLFVVNYLISLMGY